MTDSTPTTTYAVGNIPLFEGLRFEYVECSGEIKDMIRIELQDATGEVLNQRSAIAASRGDQWCRDTEQELLVPAAMKRGVLKHLKGAIGGYRGWCEDFFVDALREQVIEELRRRGWHVTTESRWGKDDIESFGPRADEECQLRLDFSVNTSKGSRGRYRPPQSHPALEIDVVRPKGGSRSPERLAAWVYGKRLNKSDRNVTADEIANALMRGHEYWLKRQVKRQVKRDAEKAEKERVRALNASAPQGVTVGGEYGHSDEVVFRSGLLTHEQTEKLIAFSRTELGLDTDKPQCPKCGSARLQRTTNDDDEPCLECQDCYAEIPLEDPS